MGDNDVLRDEECSENSTFFTIMNESGEEVECEVLFTFDSEETGKSYIVYTDNTIDEDGNTKVYASCYDQDGDITELLPVETEREWEIVEAILDSLKEDPED